MSGILIKHVRKLHIGKFHKLLHVLLLLIFTYYYLGTYCVGYKLPIGSDQNHRAPKNLNIGFDVNSPYTIKVSRGHMTQTCWFES